VLPFAGSDMFITPGDHTLTILADGYRNEHRRFHVNRWETLNMQVALEDMTPLLLFEAPTGTVITVDGMQVSGSSPFRTTPGPHTVKMELAGYAMTRTVQVENGKTYTVTLQTDINIREGD
jgi:hypothetical protein